MKQRLILKLYGQVQGMSFRSMVKVKALSLSLTGYVRNVLNDSVEIVAEGEKENLESLLKWIYTLPGHIKISHLEDYWETAQGDFVNFEIRG